jgi:hypothetical protein
MPSSPRLPRRAVVAGVVFASLPWATLGFGSVLVFGVAALFLSTVERGMVRVLTGSALMYLAAAAVWLANVDAVAGSDGDTASFLAFVVLYFGGGLQALCFAPWVAGKVRGPRPEPTLDELIAAVTDEERGTVEIDPALRFAVRQRERRRIARQLLADDPALAATLRIGRPDLDRDFVDGGLIDVNQVPSWVLADLPGFTQAMAEHVVGVRERWDGLRSSADLVVHADVPAEVVDALDDVLAFSRGPIS